MWGASCGAWYFAVIIVPSETHGSQVAGPIGVHGGRIGGEGRASRIEILACNCAISQRRASISALSSFLVILLVLVINLVHHAPHNLFLAAVVFPQRLITVAFGVLPTRPDRLVVRN